MKDSQHQKIVLDDVSSAVLSIIRGAIWGSRIGDVDQAVYNEINNQALCALPARIIDSIPMCDSLREEWKKAIYQQVSYNVNYLKAQEELPVAVPYAILKGSSAAQYYPFPFLRTMGDIDIMTKREDFGTACEMLLQHGYKEVNKATNIRLKRHRQFLKDGIEIEVHYVFSDQADERKAGIIDDYIINNITTSHILPDEINGLVLIDHINHHMEEGLGLRQIIDFMMYADKCLPDNKWPAFQDLMQKVGYNQLAITTIRMCELFLGLSEHTYCADVDISVCNRYMDYILECGNFGKKIERETITSINILSKMRSFREVIYILQQRGLKNLKTSQSNHSLQCLAWLFQAAKYIRKGLSRYKSLTLLKKDYLEALNKSMLFNELGVVSRSDRSV